MVVGIASHGITMQGVVWRRPETVETLEGGAIRSVAVAGWQATYGITVLEVVWCRPENVETSEARTVGGVGGRSDKRRTALLCRG